MANPPLRKYIVSVAKRVGADLLKLAVPKIADVVSGRQNLKIKPVGHEKNFSQTFLNNNWE